MKDWNAAYVNGDIPWDKGSAAPPLVEFLSQRSVQGRVLVPGCGLGHDVRVIAEQGATVVGMDIAPNAVSQASEILAKSDERYFVADFLDLPLEWHGSFDWVLEHTCLCALEMDQRSAYATSVAKALKPAGYYLAIFYREVSDYEGDGPPHPISTEQIDRLFGGLFERVESFVPAEGYPSRPYGSEEVVLFRKR